MLPTDIQPTRADGRRSTCGPWRVRLIAMIALAVLSTLLQPGPVGAQANLSGELVHVTSAPKDGFVLYSDGTKQWVNGSCFDSLRSGGIDSRWAKYPTEVHPKPKKRPALDCEQLRELFSDDVSPPPSNPLTFTAELVTVQTKTTNQDGFALFNHGTQHWVHWDCFAELVAKGVGTRRVSYGGQVSPVPEQSPRFSCDELFVMMTDDTSEPPTPPPSPVLEAALVTVTTKAQDQDGFALFSDATQHWVDPGCFAELVAAGVNAPKVSYSAEVDSRVKRSERFSCDELLVMMDVTEEPPPSENRILVDAPGRVAGQSLQQALRSAEPGDVFVLLGGSYNPISISGLHGTAAAPIVIEASSPTRAVRFETNSHSSGTAVRVSESSHLEIRDIHVRHSLFGIVVDDSSDVLIDSVDVADVGQEAIRVRASGSVSERITIRNSRIGDTGNRSGSDSGGEPYSTYGEGIYLGDGSSESELVRDVRIINNEIYDTSTEAIDVKYPVRQVLIDGNVIRDVATGTSGAVAIHVNGSADRRDPDVRVRGNTFRNISDRTPYRDGNAITMATSVTVDSNTFSNIADHAVRIDSNRPSGATITVQVPSNNSFSDVGRQNVVVYGGGSVNLIR